MKKNVFVYELNEVNELWQVKKHVQITQSLIISQLKNTKTNLKQTLTFVEW